MQKLLLIDGNSIINRAFYGIMGNKMLMTDDGTYTNAVYGFLAILFKELEVTKPEYIVVAFDLKAPTYRHKLYSEYKANRKGMPDELACQMPILKEVLNTMNITIIEKEGYEADDILGTLAKWGQNNKLEVTILTGDRDSFQLIDNSIKVRIPRTKMGKTETDDYDIARINEEYGIAPKDFIEVKGLMGDKSDNIPGIPGIGEKTALDLIKQYKTLDEVYKNVNNLKGKLKEKIIENEELAYVSRQLGTINVNAPIEENLEDFKLNEWKNDNVFQIFKKLKFNRFIDRFNLKDNNIQTNNKIELKHRRANAEDLKNIVEEINKSGIMFYYINTTKTEEFSISGKKISSVTIYSVQSNTAFDVNNLDELIQVFENKSILKCGYKQREDYILLKQEAIIVQNLMFDVEIAAYLLNSNTSKYSLDYLANEYLKIDLSEYMQGNIKENEQINLFETINAEDFSPYFYSYIIYQLYNVLKTKLNEANSIELFNTIEMPLVPVLAEMQYLRDICR